MQMKNALPDADAVIDNKAKGILNTFLPRNLVGHQIEVSEQRLIVIDSINNSRYRLKRYEQDMDRSLRIYITKGETLIVLIDDISRNFPVDYLAKYCIRHVKSPKWHMDRKNEAGIIGASTKKIH